jgi:1,2-diacylglycerol 3-beta-glucosyltransferase
MVLYPKYKTALNALILMSIASVYTSLILLSSHTYFFIFSFLVLYFVLFNCFSLKGTTIESLELEKARVFPTISIVVCARNEEKVIRSLIYSLGKINYPRRYLDILIVNHNSSDNTSSIIAETLSNYPYMNSHLSLNKLGYKAAILNEVYPNLKGDFIAMFDADANIPPDIFIDTILGFEDPKVGAIEFHKSVYNCSKNLITKYVNMDYQNPTKNLSGGGVIIRRSAYHTTKGWQEHSLTEDYEMTFQLLSANWICLYPENPVVKIEAPQTVQSFIRQRIRWSLGDQSCVLTELFQIIRYSFSSKFRDYEVFIKQIFVIVFSIILFELLLIEIFKQKVMLFFLIFILGIFIIDLLATIIKDSSHVITDLGDTVRINILKLHIYPITLIALFQLLFFSKTKIQWYSPNHRGKQT